MGWGLLRSRFAKFYVYLPEYVKSSSHGVHRLGGEATLLTEKSTLKISFDYIRHLPLLRRYQKLRPRESEILSMRHFYNILWSYKSLVVLVLPYFREYVYIYTYIVLSPTASFVSNFVSPEDYFQPSSSPPEPQSGVVLTKPCLRGSSCRIFHWSSLSLSHMTYPHSLRSYLSYR